MAPGSFVAGADLQKIRACLRQTQCTVRATAHDVRVVIVLPVVFPETDRANLESTALAERSAATAGATERKAAWLALDSTCVLLKPVEST